MDTDSPQAQTSPDGSPLPCLDYRSGPQRKPEVEPNCLLAFRLAVVSLLLPPVAVIALVKAGYGMAEVRRSQGPGRGHAIWAIALSVILPCLFGLFAWSAWGGRSSGDSLLCAANLRPLGYWVAMYEKSYPNDVGNDLGAVIKHAGVSPRDVPTCVRQQKNEAVIASGAISTTYMLLPRTRRLDQIRSGEIVLAVDLSVHTLRFSPSVPVINLLFCDGHVETRFVDEAREEIAKSIPVLMGVSPTTVPAVGRDVK